MSEKASSVVDITILVCTFNRARDLSELLESALAQETGGAFTYEVLVVDNNSSDDTRAVVESFVSGGHGDLRYMFEERQGKSYALNTGLRAMRGELYSITDDDFILPPGWLKKIVEAFRAHPEAAFVSGKVSPLWQSEPPRWLTPKHWSAIAMADHGDEEFYVDASRQVCLLACAFRRADVIAVGGYRQELGVSGERIGGTEDAELLMRLWIPGRKGLYLPNIELFHKVEAKRLTKSYHRRWHTDHGRQHAVMRVPEIEQGQARLFDVPAHLYRQAARDALNWLSASLRLDEAAILWHEKQLRFFVGFFQQRRRDYLAAGQRPRGAIRELASFARTLATGRREETPKRLR